MTSEKTGEIKRDHQAFRPQQHKNIENILYLNFFDDRLWAPKSGI
jgi:hypothetical protein